VDFAIVPTPCPRTGSAYDFSHSAEQVATSLALTRRWIAGGGLGRREIPDALRAHGHA
jgi:NTE family protein